MFKQDTCKYLTGRIICGLFLLFTIGLAQSPDSISATSFSFGLPSPDAIFEWNTGWKDENGSSVELPDIHEWSESPIYTRQFDLPCNLDDSAFLVIEGLAWYGQLSLNGAFLALQKQPLKRWTIPIAPQFFREKKNTIQIQSFKGPLVDFSPEPFNGLLGSVFLMTREQYESYSKAFARGTAPEGATLAAIVPWDDANGFSFDPFRLSLALQAAARQKVRHVWFPVYSNTDLVAFCREAGFEVVASIHPKQSIIWYQPFPYEAASFAVQPVFWQDKEGKRSANFGESGKKLPVRLPWSIVILGLLPLAMAATFKVFSPTSYRSLWTSWQAPARGMDNWFESLLSNGTANLMITLLRVLQAAAVISLWIWVLRGEGLLGWLNIFKDWSILNQLFNAIQNPVTLFLKAFFLYAAVVGALFIINSVLGVVFKRNDFAFAVLAFENLASFPVWWGLGAALLLAASIMPGLRILALCFVGLFFLWRVIILYLNAEKRLGITGGVKYLYICASIFPYLLLF